MAQQVQVFGRIVEFPDGMHPDAMAAAIRANEHVLNPDYKPRGESADAIDYVKGAAAGANKLVSGVGYLAESVGADKIGKSLRSVGDRGAEYWNEKMTAAGKAAAGSQVFEDDPNAITGLKLTDKWGQALLMGASQSSPSMLAAAIPGGLATAGIQALARLGLAGGAGATIPLLAGTAAPIGAASNVIARAPAAIGFGAAEGVTAGAMNAADMKSSIEKMTHQELLKSPVYSALAQQHGPEVARTMVAEQAAHNVFGPTAISTGTIGALTGGGALAQAYQKSAGIAKGGIVSQTLKGAGQEAIQETPQSGGEKYIENLARQKFLDPSIEPMSGVAAAAASGGAVGGLTGGVFGGAGAVSLPQGKASPVSAAQPTDTSIHQPADTAETQPAQTVTPQSDALHGEELLKDPLQSTPAAVAPAKSVDEAIAAANTELQKTTELNDFIRSERRDKNIMLAEMQVAKQRGDVAKQRAMELDAIQQAGNEALGRTGDQQIAAAQASLDEGPAALELAFKKAQQNNVKVAPVNGKATLPPVSLALPDTALANAFSEAQRKLQETPNVATQNPITTPAQTSQTAASQVHPLDIATPGNLDQPLGNAAASNIAIAKLLHNGPAVTSNGQIISPLPVGVSPEQDAAAPQAVSRETAPISAPIQPTAAAQGAIKILSDGRYAATGFTPEVLRSVNPGIFIDAKGVGVFPAKTNKIQLERALGISQIPEGARLASGDAPFVKRIAAEKLVVQEKLSKTHKIMPIDGGYAIVPRGAIQAAMQPASIPAENANKVDTSAQPVAKAAGSIQVTREPWQMTALEYSRSRVSPALREQIIAPQDTFKAQHRQEIKAALSDGKQVPAEVLADYPELQNKSEPATKVPTEKQVADEKKQAEAATAKAEETFNPQSFIKAPDGSLDFGEITADQAKAMKRQAGGIRLLRGEHNADGTGYGLAHIESNHGKQIRNAGFGSAEEFVSRVATKFNEVFQASGRQLLVAVDGGRQDVMFVQLEPAPDGDYYRINTAFPASRDYLEKQQKNGMKLLWGGSEPTSTVSGKQSLYAGAPENNSGQDAPIAQGQSKTSITPTTAESNPRADADSTKQPSPSYDAGIIQLSDIPRSLMIEVETDKGTTETVHAYRQMKATNQLIEKYKSLLGCLG